MSEHTADVSEARCRSCAAPVFWTVTANGKKMQVDAEPAADGNVEVNRQGGIVRARVLSRHELEELPDDEHGALAELHKAHFATCPDSDYWRKS